jgi:2-hydroxychromene-2-carboxylate isomerase
MNVSVEFHFDFGSPNAYDTSLHFQGLEERTRLLRAQRNHNGN